MGVECLSECPECNRHLQCGERSCPFCGARVTTLMRVLDYRLKTQLSRSRLFSIGAAFAAAGFAVDCDRAQEVAIYGAPCTPTTCSPGGGTSSTAGQANTSGASGYAGGGFGGMGTAGSSGTAGNGGTAPMAGAAGEGGSSTDGGANEGGAAGEPGETGDGGGGGGGVGGS